MNITILNLCNTCNSVYWDSEPYIWVKHPDGYIYFVNQNTKKVEFRLEQHTACHHNEAGSYAFYVESLDETVWLDFFKEVPLLPGEVACN